MTNSYEVIIVRLGEITVKSKRVRKHFEKRLINNIKDALERNNIKYDKIISEWGRIYVLADYEAINILKRVFGITSLSPAFSTKFENFEDLLNKGENYFKDKVKNKTFAVRARRVGKHNFKSPDIEKSLGSRLLQYSKGVNLENPDITAYLEVRYNRVYFYTEIIKAYGGLPIGVEGRTVALVSGGYDSIVASWFLLKRGSEVHFVFCNLDGLPYKIAVLNVLKALIEKWCFGYDPKIYILNLKPLLKELYKKCDHGILNVLLKRLMYRAAESIAEQVGGKAIVTGESLGQVSSQTLQNLYVSSQVVKVPIFRPLIGFDKKEIIEISRGIGTYEASTMVKEYCGALVEHPRTSASLDEILLNERKIDVDRLLEEVIRSAEVLTRDKIELPKDIFFEIDHIPRDAIVIDLRPEEKFRKWHIPNSINLPFMEFYEKIDSFDKNKKYVLVCDEGALSLESAYILRTRGIEAYSLKGGIRKYKRKLVNS